MVYVRGDTKSHVIVPNQDSNNRTRYKEGGTKCFHTAGFQGSLNVDEANLFNWPVFSFDG